jgi:hypothetical protein
VRRSELSERNPGAMRPSIRFMFAALLLAGSAAFTFSDAPASMPSAFQPAATYGTGGLATIFPNTGGPVWILAADVNGDGRPDLLVANGCGNVSSCATGGVGVLLNKGDGTFQPAVTYDSGGSFAISVSVADMNGDGVPDLIVANLCASFPQQPPCPDGSVGVLLGNGDGTFRPVRAFPSGGRLSALVVADVNHDGRPDAVVSNCAPTGQFCSTVNGNVAILIGNGDGSLQPAQLYDSGGLAASFVAVADVNADGAPDVLVTNARVCDNCRGNLGVLLGRGDGTFQSVQTYDAGIFAPAFIATADFNGDQKTDVVLTQNIGGGGELAVLLNRGDGTFQTAAIYATGGQDATPLIVADTNRDGKLDLIVSNSLFCTGLSPGISCIGVLLGIGDGTFQPAVTYESGGTGAWSLAAADFNGDGVLDVAVAHQCQPSSCSGPTAVVGVLDGNGDGTFQRPVTYNTNAPSVLVLATDVSGDGRPDLVVGNAPPPGASIDVLLNNTVPDDVVPPAIVVSVTPDILWPPTGAMLTVTVSGTITDANSGVNAASAAFSVADEYGAIQPSGAVVLGSGGAFSFTTLLQATRRGSDGDGRHYTVTIRATDNAGNVGTASAIVTVPHDRRH